MTWVLHTLAAARGAELRPSQAQACLYLLQRAFEVGYEDFEAALWMPTSREAYKDLREAVRRGWVLWTLVPGRNWHGYVITPAGRAEAEKHEAQADALEYLQRVVRWALQLKW